MDTMGLHTAKMDTAHIYIYTYIHTHICTYSYTDIVTVYPFLVVYHPMISYCIISMVISGTQTEGT